MALSKVWNVVASNPRPILGLMWGAGDRFAVRVAAPFLELGEDMTEGITFYVTSVVEIALAFARSDNSLAVVQKLEKLPLTRALIELSEDCGGLWLPMLAIALCPHTAGPLVLASASFPLKVTYLCASGACAAGMMHFMFGIWRTDGPWNLSLGKQLIGNAVGVMLVSASINFCLAFGGLPAVMAAAGVPATIIDHIIFPEVLLFSLANLALYPFILIDLGSVSGFMPVQMVPSIVLTAMSSCFMMLSSTSFTWPIIFGYPAGAFLCTGAAFGCWLGGYRLLGNLPDNAGQITFANKKSSENTINAMMVFWSVAPLIQAFTIVDVVSVEQACALFAVTELCGKFAVLRALLRNGHAVGAAAQHFSDN